MRKNHILFPGGSAYARKIKSLFDSSIVAYWPQNESGGTVSRDIGGRNLNGKYTGVTLRAQGIGDGETAASYDGSTSYNNIYSAGLASAFNGAEGTLLAWARVSGAGVWTDTALRYAACFQVDSNNRLIIRKSSVNNTLDYLYIAGGTVKTTSATISRTIYICAAMTFTKSADALRAYVDGTQVGSTLTGLGVWSGSLPSTSVCVGANNTTPSNVWSGSIGPVLLLNRAATAGEIAAASTL